MKAAARYAGLLSKRSPRAARTCPESYTLPPTTRAARGSFFLTAYDTCSRMSLTCSRHWKLARKLCQEARRG